MSPPRSPAHVQDLRLGFRCGGSYPALKTACHLQNQIPPVFPTRPFSATPANHPALTIDTHVCQAPVLITPSHHLLSPFPLLPSAYTIPSFIFSPACIDCPLLLVNRFCLQGLLMATFTSQSTCCPCLTGPLHCESLLYVILLHSTSGLAH